MDKEKQVTHMFDMISKTYDRTNAVLSFGLDKLWRKKMIQNLPQKEHLSLLDVATGTGEVLMEAFEQNRIEMGIGIDLSEKMLEIAQKKFDQSPFRPQVQFVAASALKLPFENAHFDAATISYGIRNVQDVSLALKEMYRILKPKGTLLILEFSLPTNKLLKAMHLLYLRKILPRVGGALSKSKDSYTYLNQTIESFPYGEAFIEHLKKAGFMNCVAKPILGGITTLYVGHKH